MRIFLIHVAVVAAVGAPFCAGGQLDWPPSGPATKPWTRWWWHGSAVNERDLTAEMEKYAAAGLGGLEITPIYGVRGEEDKFIPYLSPKWVEMLEHTLREGKRLGLGIDMATGTGWPFGGPWVDADSACKNLVVETYSLHGGQSLDNRVVHLQQPLVRAVGRRVNIRVLKEPLSANANLQALALDQVRFEKPLPLVTLMAYPTHGDAIDLTALVDRDGKLDWTAPESDWTLYALFQGWHGKQVERAAPGGEGDVIDHFDGSAVKRYLQHFDDAFAGHDLSGLRAFFNDSYEVDDASGNADWSPQLLERFRMRRAYDLRQHLPALMGKDSPDANARVLCDYRQMIAEMLRDEFAPAWDAWAKGHKAITRYQAHGSPGNILDLYAASDIPEAEGTDRIAFIAASSAAHVMGKPLCSAEACTWLDEHGRETLAKAKTAVDNYFLGGVNHIVFHGTPFSPDDEPWPGRMFYASVHFGTTNTWWRHLPALNRYVERVQSFLQAGRPDNDVLVYWPIHDAWSERGRSQLAHFDGRFENTPIRKCGEALLAAGCSYDFASDRQVLHASCKDSLVQTDGAAYRALVIPPCRQMPLPTFHKVIDLAREGVPVVVLDQMPRDVPGWAGFEARRAKLLEYADELHFAPADESGVSEADVGHGRILISGNVAGTLGAVGVVPELMVKDGLQFVRRQFDDGVCYFIVNSGGKRWDDWTPLRAAARSAALFDGMSGERGIAECRTTIEGGTEVYLQLEPGQSCILRTFDHHVDGEPLLFWKEVAAPSEVDAMWSVEFVDGGPTLPPTVANNRLQSWTELGDAAYRNFSGTAVYRTKLAKPAGDGEAWRLDLGEVHETAVVRLNGRELSTLIGPPYRVAIPATDLHEGDNEVEIEVANLMANRLADMDRRGVPWKRFYNANIAAKLPENRGKDGLFDASYWSPRSSGLIGPVTLTPLRRKTADR